LNGHDHPSRESSWIGGLVVRAIGAWQCRIARTRGVRAPLTGAVTFVQRFGGLVNLNVHFHLVDAPFGLWVWGWGTPLTSTFTANVSYGYPGGMNVAPINDIIF
jgi:hypothetical protein